MITAQVLGGLAVHTAITGLISLCLMGLVLVDTEALFGQTLFWALVLIIGKISQLWIHLVNDVRHLERFIENFKIDKGSYKIKMQEYIFHVLETGNISGNSDDWKRSYLDKYNLTIFALRYASCVFGFILITVSFNVLPGLAIFSIVLAAMIVTIRQVNLDRHNRIIEWERYIRNRFLDFFSYAGGMFAAAMIVYAVTHAASQQKGADTISAECRSENSEHCEAN